MRSSPHCGSTHTNIDMVQEQPPDVSTDIDGSIGFDQPFDQRLCFALMQASRSNHDRYERRFKASFQNSKKTSRN